MIKGKTLYVSDMDGTLLGSDGRVSDRTAGIITRLSYLGVPITVATARTPATVRPLLAHTHTIVDAVVMRSHVESCRQCVYRCPLYVCCRRPARA